MTLKEGYLPLKISFAYGFFLLEFEQKKLQERKKVKRNHRKGVNSRFGAPQAGKFRVFVCFLSKFLMYGHI